MSFLENLRSPLAPMRYAFWVPPVAPPSASVDASIQERRRLMRGKQLVIFTVCCRSTHSSSHLRDTLRRLVVVCVETMSNPTLPSLRAMSLFTDFVKAG
jgi:hypothetical protein